MEADPVPPMGVLLARAGYALFDLKPKDQEHAISLLEQSAKKLRINCCDNDSNNKMTVKD